jgi:hypothetical protein
MLAHQRERYASDPEYRERKKRRAREDAAERTPEERRARHTAWRTENAEHVREYDLARRAAETPEKHAARRERERLAQATPEAKAAKRAWYQENRDRVLADRRRQKYAITPEQVEELCAAQGGRCAICADAFTTTRNTHVDHCHTTGVVRGMLCNHCNRGLGCFRDRPEVLGEAIAYLQKHATVT